MGYLGRYYKTGGRQRTITYEKKNRNFLLGKLFVENTITLDGEKFSQEKLDTRSTPYTMAWFSQPVRGLFPITRDITGQDEMIVSAWHTPGKELKIETNLPEVQSMKVTSAGPTKKFEFNGKEVATVDFDSSSKRASHTMHLPSGKDLTMDLAWPKMTPAASDLEFGVTITPGWETTSFPGRESLRRSLALSTRSSGPATVRPPRGSFAGFPLWRPTWLPVSTSGTCRLTPSYGSPLLDRSTASPSPTTSSHFWRESTDYCISLGSQLQKYKMAIRPQKYKIVFHYLA